MSATLSISPVDATCLNPAAARRRIHSSIAGRLLALLLLLSTLLGRLCYLAQPFDSDAAMFIYMGKLIDEGGRVGRELIDNKFPTVGLLTGVPWRAFGASWPPYVILGWLLTAIASATLGRAMSRRLGRPHGWATGLATMVFLNFHTAVYAGFQLETIHACLAALAAAAAIEALLGRDGRDAWLVGLTAGVAAMAKPSGLAVAAVFIVAIPFSHDSWRVRFRLFIATLAGLAIPAAVVTAYLVAADNARDMPALWRQIARYAADSSFNTADLVKPAIAAALIGWPMLVRGWVFRRRRAETPPTLRPIALFALLWLAAEAAGVAGQRRMYAYHFFVLGPPVALLYGLFPRRDSAACLAGSLLPLAVVSSIASIAFLQRTIHQPATLTASDHLNRHAAPGDSVWRDDAPRLWIETNLPAGSRLPLTFLFANSDEAPLEFGQALLDDFERRRPTYILLPRNAAAYAQRQTESIAELRRSPRRENHLLAWRWIDDHVRSHYTAVIDLDDETLWRRDAADRSTGRAGLAEKTP